MKTAIQTFILIFICNCTSVPPKSDKSNSISSRIKPDSTNFISSIFNQNGIKGVIFTNKNQLNYYSTKSDTLLTPTQIDIKLCEESIKNFLSKEINNTQNGMSINNKYLYIQSNLNQYFRQYYMHKHNDKTIITIRSGIINDIDLYDWIKAESDVWGGGSNFWIATCLKENYEISDFSINEIE